MITILLCAAACCCTAFIGYSFGWQAGWLVGSKDTRIIMSGKEKKE